MHNTRHYSPAQNRSPSPPRRLPTQAELNARAAREKANRNAAEAKRVVAEAKRVAANVNNAVKLNNVFLKNSRAAAANVNNAAKLNNVFRKNKTILAKIHRGVERIREGVKRMRK